MKARKTIHKMLIDKDMTVKDLAKKIGKSAAWTSYVINGHWVGTETRKDIARTLGVKVDDIWGDDQKVA